MMLIDASWPSNRLAAVTKRTLWVGFATGGFLAMAVSFIGGSRGANAIQRAGARGKAYSTPQAGHTTLRLRKRQSMLATLRASRHARGGCPVPGAPPQDWPTIC